MIAAAPFVAAAPTAAQVTPMPTPVSPMTPQPSPDMPPPPPVAPPPTIKPTTPGPAGVAAIVNGVKIYRYQVANQVINLYGPQVLNTLILIELINQEASKQHVIITPAQVDAQLAAVRVQAAARVSGGLDAVLSQRRQTLDSFKQQLLTQMQAEALTEKTLPPAPAAQTLYHARHLLIMTAAPAMAPGAKAPHTDAEALALIAKAQAELKAGKSFTEVANTYTEDPSGKGKGGDLPAFGAASGYDPSFFKATQALKPGETTAAPVKSQFGYHLIQLESTSAAPGADAKLYADAADAARRQRIDPAIPAYVQSLRARSKVINYLGQ